MDVKDLIMSCKRGDTARVEYLLDQKEVEVNVRDKWDSTPLYYACLCGHKELVEMLLSRGAKCAANTFDGERCIYGALTNEIRSLLKNTYKVVTNHIIRRDDYEEFLRRLLESGEYADASFIVHGEEFFIHKCILSARSDYFCDMFETRWKNKSEITIKNDLVRPAAFKSLLQYLYTGRMETHIELVEDIVILADHCKLKQLKEQLEEYVERVADFASMKPGTHVTTLVLESGSAVDDVMCDFSILAEQALPRDLCSWVGGLELPGLPSVSPAFVDLIICVEGYSFFCHKAFLCGRSEYFRALVEDHFSEISVDSTEIPMMKLRDITAKVFIQILHYIYKNSAPLYEDVVVDVLGVADMYLLPGLKRQCGTFLADLISEDNVVSLIQTSRLYNIPRLEDRCTEYIANNIESMVDVLEFRSLVRMDADLVYDRHQTDSIDIVDNIRYQITEHVQTFSEIKEANERLAAIDRMLDELDLDA